MFLAAGKDFKICSGKSSWQINVTTLIFTMSSNERVFLWCTNKRWNVVNLSLFILVVPSARWNRFVRSHSSGFGQDPALGSVNYTLSSSGKFGKNTRATGQGAISLHAKVHPHDRVVIGIGRLGTCESRVWQRVMQSYVAYMQSLSTITALCVSLKSTE